MAKREFGVIGLGRFGTSLARELTHLGCTVLVVDQDPVKVQEISCEIEQALVLDATSEEALANSGILEFSTVVVCIGADFESNILITNLLKELGCKRVISKALSPRQRNILLKTGADAVILPEFEAGQRLAQTLVQPDCQIATALPVGISTIIVPCRSGWESQTIGQIGLPAGVVVVSIRHSPQTSGPSSPSGRELMPSHDYRFQPGDQVMLLGLDSALQAYH